MSQNLALGFKIDADAAKAINTVAAFTRQLQAAAGVKAIPDPTRDLQAGVASSVKGLGGLLGVLATVAAAAVGVGAALKAGFANNSEMENATLGIQGIIASLQDVRDAAGKPAEGMERLQIAGSEAEKQLKLLRVAGMQTSAEFKDLAAAFQTALGAGSGAGLGVDQIRQLTVKLTLAASAFNLQGNQLSSEIRAMLSGEQLDNSQIATGLSISPAQIKLWREQGTLADELNKRLEQFARLGEQAGKSWASTLSNVKDGINIFLGEVTEGAFEKVKTALQDAMSGVFDQNGDIRKEFKGLADFATTVFNGIGTVLAEAIRGGLDLLRDLSKFFDDNKDSIDRNAQAVGIVWDVFKSLLGTVGDIIKSTGEWGSKTFSLTDTLKGVAFLFAGLQDALTGIKILTAEVGAAIIDNMAAPLKRTLMNVADFLARLPGIGEGLANAVRGIAEAIPKDGSGLKQYAQMLRSDIALNGTAMEQVHLRFKNMERDAKAAREAAAELERESRRGNKGAGSVKPPAKKPSDDAKKAAQAYADALLAYERDKAEADKRIAKVAKEASLLDLERQFAERIKTQEQYLKEKAALDAEEIAQDLAAANKAKAAFEARIASEKDPAKQKRLEGDLEKVKAEIRELESKGAQVPVRLKMDLDKFKAEVQSLEVEIKATILDQEGQPYEAAVVRLKKKTDDLLKDPRVRGNAGLTADVKRSNDNESERLKMEEAKRVADYQASVYSEAQQRIAEAVRTGQMTEIQGQRQLQAEQAKTVDGLKAYLEALATLKTMFPKNREIALAFEQVTDALEKARKKTDEVALSINRTFADNAGNAIGTFVRDSLSHLEDLVKGTETANQAMKGIFRSARDAIRGLFFSLADDIAKRFQKLMADEIFKALQGKEGGGLGGMLSSFLGGGSGSGGGMNWGALLSGVTSMFSGFFSYLQSMFSSMMSGMGGMMGFADGGHIRGPGTGTSDSILARLSNGEYVLKASAVRKWGVGFLDSLNAGYLPRQMPAFASGGAVLSGMAQGGGASQVNVTNNNVARLFMNLHDVASEIGRTPQFGRDVIEVVLRNKSKLGLT